MTKARTSRLSIRHILFLSIGSLLVVSFSAQSKLGLLSSVVLNDLIGPVFEAAHLSPSVQPTAFAGCLLVLDDNFRMAEWLSYHYHVLPLRYLIVAVDARSKASPEPIFQRFRNHLRDMTILMWTDADYGDWEPLAANETSMNPLRSRHRLRQKTFLQKCMLHLYEHNQTWTMLWDTDEFISYTHFNHTRSNPNKPHLSATSPPNLVQPGTMIGYVARYSREEACLSLNRAYVGANETSPTILEKEKHVVDPRQLDTLRYRHRNDWDAKLNGRGKCMLNVQYVNHSFEVKSPHKPAPYLCPNEMYGPTKDSPFYLLHYISSWEAYSFRDDGRKGRERTREAWLARAFEPSRHYDETTTLWLQGFVESVGNETAALLLEGSGLPADYDASDKIRDFKCQVGRKCKQDPANSTR